MNLSEKQLKKQTVYNGKIINLRKDTAILPDGNTALREVVEHPGGVGVLALTDDNNILMVKQFRYPYNEIIYEIPAGKRNSKDEAPIECGKRELKEETGATTDDFIFLGEVYPTPGYCEEIIYLYAAKNLSFGEMSPDDDEFIECEKLPLDKLVDDVISGKIKDAKTQIAILKLKYLIDNNRI